MPTDIKTVPERLRALGDLYEERNALYGDNYKHFGKTLVGMFPHGLTLETEEQFNRFCLFLQIVHKASRYARSVTEQGHWDSLDDTSVYAQMLREFDDERNAAREAATSSLWDNNRAKE